MFTEVGHLVHERGPEANGTDCGHSAGDVHLHHGQLGDLVTAGAEDKKKVGIL